MVISLGEQRTRDTLTVAPLRLDSHLLHHTWYCKREEPGGTVVCPGRRPDVARAVPVTSVVPPRPTSGPCTVTQGPADITIVNQK